MPVACFAMPQFGIAVERARLTHLWGVPLGLAWPSPPNPLSQEQERGSNVSSRSTSSPSPVLGGRGGGMGAPEGETLTAVSDEAAPFGIRVGQSVAGAKALCEALVVLPYDREAYEEAAHSIWDLFAIESSVVEPVSPELCYVELTGPDVVERAKELASALAARVRIPVSVGVAPNKFVARQAAAPSTPPPKGGGQGVQGTAAPAPGLTESNPKPNPSSGSIIRPDDETVSSPFRGQGGTPRMWETWNWKPPTSHTPTPPILPHSPTPLLPHSPSSRVVASGREAAFLAALPVERLPGLDFKTRQRLQKLGVRTLGDFAKIPPREMQKQLKEVAHRLRRLAQGEDSERVRPLWPPRRIEREVEFEEETVAQAEVSEGLRQCAEQIAAKLSAEREYCRSLTLRVALADGSWLEEREKLAMPVGGERERSGARSLHGATAAPVLLRAAQRLLGRMAIEQPLLRVALTAGDLGAGSGVQLALLDDNRHGHGLPHERARALDAALALLRKRYGAGAVLTAGRMRQAKRIGLWTYPLGHVLDEPVRVATDERGRPVRFWRRGQAREVRQIQDRWREAEWFWGSLSERTVYRVETDSAGLAELHRLGPHWRLTALAD